MSWKLMNYPLRNTQTGWIAPRCDKRDGLEKMDSEVSLNGKQLMKNNQIARVALANTHKLLVLIIFGPGD